MELLLLEGADGDPLVDALKLSVVDDVVAGGAVAAGVKLEVVTGETSRKRFRLHV